MAKFTFNDITDAVGSTEGAGGGGYTGPTPPAGVYRTVAKRLGIKISNGAKTKGTPMLNGVLEIKESGDKKKYSGYGIWFNILINDQFKGMINQFLNAASGGEEAGLKLQRLFWTKGITTKADEKAGVEFITKIGNKTVKDGTFELSVATEVSTYNDKERLQVKTYLVPVDEKSTAEDDDLDDDLDGLDDEADDLDDDADDLDDDLGDDDGDDLDDDLDDDDDDLMEEEDDDEDDEAPF